MFFTKFNALDGQKFNASDGPKFNVLDGPNFFLNFAAAAAAGAYRRCRQADGRKPRPPPRRRLQKLRNKSTKNTEQNRKIYKKMSKQMC